MLSISFNCYFGLEQTCVQVTPGKLGGGPISETFHRSSVNALNPKGGYCAPLF